MRYARAVLFAAAVAFGLCFLLLRVWLKLDAAAASLAAGVSAAAALTAGGLGIVKATHEIEKLQLENRKLKREEEGSSRRVVSPSLPEIDKYGLQTNVFISRVHEERDSPK